MTYLEIKNLTCRLGIQLVAAASIAMSGATTIIVMLATTQSGGHATNVVATASAMVAATFHGYQAKSGSPQRPCIIWGCAVTIDVTVGLEGLMNGGVPTFTKVTAFCYAATVTTTAIVIMNAAHTLIRNAAGWGRTASAMIAAALHWSSSKESRWRYTIRIHGAVGVSDQGSVG